MIQTDWTSSDVTFIDFESVSTSDLRAVGGRNYAEDANTRILCCSILSPTRREIWVPEWVPLTLPTTVNGFRVTRTTPHVTGVLCAHNALEFDAHIWKRFIGEAVWRDTLPLCRAAGLPGGLDAACDRLFGLRKDPRGKVLDVLCRAKMRGGKPEYPLGTGDAWNDLLAYCVSDAELLQRLHTAVLPYAEPDVLRANQAVNDRGFPIDVELAVKLVELQSELAYNTKQEIADLTEGDLYVNDAGSVQRVKRWLEERGVRLPQRDGKPSLNRHDLRKLLDDPEEFCGEMDPDLVATVLRLRTTVTRNTAARALRMLQAVGKDHRARGQHVYYGAHTGRWSGKQVQPHNFPTGVGGVSASISRPDVTLEEVAAEAQRLRVEPADVLSTMLRHCVAGSSPLSIIDYGQIEARGVCWLAGEPGALKMFADPTRDYYKHFMAPLLFGAGVEIDDEKRGFSKITGLGCGYSMSGRRMRAYMVANGIDFVAAGVSPEGVVDAYRKAHSNVVRGWRDLERAAFSAMEGRPATACRCHFRTEGKCLVAVLPSGRRIVYRDAAVEMQVPFWATAQGIAMPPQPTIAYTRPQGWRGTLYGGRIMENVTQGGMRDVLADAVVRSEDAGMEPILHCHDELVCANADIDDMADLMTKKPEWMEDFPLAVEGFSSPRYVKKPYKGTRVVKVLK
jgi:DNA polymerase